ncbi:MAG: NADH-quinone oxidoreductase subunit [Nocardioidaceae bacterium]|jgi:NADH-quinone oxidoreductase subunit C|nr:NADH-quinone oxidoreductase subunit [Nocardioidaceae bacterium]MDX6307578.1 NADH-quinone oxidoreductase subunit [Nocardioidaceae bacterium]
MTDQGRPGSASAPEEPADSPTVGTTPHDDSAQGAADLAVNRTPAEPAALTVSDDPGAIAEPGLEVVDVRTGMFGVSGTGDTSGYGGLVRPVTLPGSTTRPYGGWFDAVADRLETAFRERTDTSQPDVPPITRVVVYRGEITFYVDRTHLVPVMQTLRDDPALRFEFCSGVSGVHFPKEVGSELHSVYHLLSMTHNRRIRVEVTCPDSDPHIPSVVSVYPTSDWHERETYDFFGIVYDGHPALTRIEMPDDWRGHPQRKDYPLGGVPVEYKGATIPPPDDRRAYN